MWFWSKKTPAPDLVADLRTAWAADGRNEPSPAADPALAPPGGPLVDGKTYYETVLPELLRRWETRCFCANPQFLKLASFDFRDYGISPTTLVDTEALVSQIVLKRFAAQGPWTKQSDGGHRHFCCPHCGRDFDVWSEEYSIAMSVISAKPIEPIVRADIGRYATSYRYFAGLEREIAFVTDYRPADSVQKYLDDLSA